jgi:hypothetical protein
MEGLAPFKPAGHRISPEGFRFANFGALQRASRTGVWRETDPPSSNWLIFSCSVQKGTLVTSIE